MGYEFRIEYKPGKANEVVDALSRKLEKEPATLDVISFPLAD